jgi:cytochrome c oxidase subunit 2
MFSFRLIARKPFQLLIMLCAVIPFLLYACSGQNSNDPAKNKRQSVDNGKVELSSQTTAPADTVKGNGITAARGHKIAEENGCFYCHTTDGTESVGPTWKGLYGRKVRLSNGTTVTANTGYIISSIVAPHAMVVKSFSDLMPRYSYLKEDQIQSLVAYFKSLSNINTKVTNAAKTNEITAQRGHQIAQSKGCLSCHSIDGSRKVGPTWKDLYGKTVKLNNGSTTTADSAYIVQSIEQPSAKVVQGFPDMMPEFTKLKKDQMASIIKYIKSISKKSS